MHRQDEDSWMREHYLRSPGEMQNDSLEIAREDGAGGREYELTFKKNQNDMFFSNQKEGQFQMSATQRQLVSHIRHPIAYYQTLPLDILASLPFADLYSLELPSRQKAKLSLIGELLEHKRMHLKSRSVSLNYRCLSLNESPTHQDKNRLFILQLLEKQLNKKCFIQALKVHYLKKKYFALYGKQEERSDYNPEKVSPSKINEQLFGEQEEQVEQARQWEEADRQWGSPSIEEQEYHEDDSRNQGQVLILIQVVSAIAKKMLFSAFKTILNHSRHRIRSPRKTNEDLSPISTSKRQVRINSPQQVLSNQLINLQHQPEQMSNPNYYVPSYQEPSQSELQIQQLIHNSPEEGEVEEGNYQSSEFNSIEEKLHELYGYIEELHDEAADSDNILRRFFLRWKIRLMEAIADSLMDQLRGEQEEQNSQVEQHRERRLTSQEQSQPENGYQEEVVDNYWSRNTTQLSQVDSNLKHEKTQLKQYLRMNEIRIFFRNLSYHHENTMIKSICGKVYRAKLMSRTFQVWKSYCQQEAHMRNMEGYCEQVAELQEEDDTTAFYFWKTSLLHRYFRAIQENRRNCKMDRVLSAITVKLAFRTLKKHSYQGKKSFQILERFRAYRESKVMFKYFVLWKQQHRSSNKHYEKLNSYKLFKKQQLKSHIFSILKLGFKKMLVKEVRATKHFALVTKDKTLQYLKLLALEGSEFRYKEDSLRQYLRQSRGNEIIDNLFIFYQEYRQYQLLVVKQEKLRRTLLGLHALKGLKTWRRKHMKHAVYEAIEAKLRKLHQKQKKKDIFQFWLRRAIDKNREGSPVNSDRHKKWLVSYYSGLCSVMPE